MIADLVDARPLRRWVAALLLLAAGAGVRACEPYPEWRHFPAVAWDGRGYLVAWEAGMPGEGAVVVQHFDRRGAALDAPWEVFRDPRMAGSVDLVRTAAGFVLLTHRVLIENPRDEVMVATWLDRDGRAIRGQSVVGWDMGVCGNPVVEPDGVTFGGRIMATGPFNPTNTLWMVQLTSHGVHLGTSYLTEGLGMCSTAMGRDGVAVVYDKWQRDAGTHELRLAFGDGHDVPVLVSRATVSARRLVATPEGFAILYAAWADQAFRYQVALVDADGAFERTLTLPPEVAAADHVDLGVSRRGLFVSWMTGRRVGVASVDDPARRVTRSAGRDRSWQVSFGHDDQCVTVWVASAGKQARMIAACP